MRAVDELKILVKELVNVLESLSEQLAPLVEKAVSAGIAQAYLTKAGRTLRAIDLLYTHGLEEQAQALIRVLLETWLSFGTFSEMAKKDERDACTRFLDSMMLEKVKQARASGFAGLEMIPGGPSAKDLEEAEAKILSGYSSADAKRMKKHGFTGLSVAQRASLLGEESNYDIVYRNFSRNVHSTDYLEHYMLQAENSAEWFQPYLEARDRVGLSTALWSAMAIALIADQLIGCPHQEKLLEVEGRRIKIMSTPPDTPIERPPSLL